MKAEELINRAKLAIKVRDFDQAIKFLNKVIKLSPDISGINILLGIIHQKLKKYKEAIEYYNLALEKNSVDIDALNNLGIIYKELHEYDKSLEYLERALKLHPKRPDILYNIGNVYKSLNKNEEAIKYFQKALQINPNFRFAYNNLGTVYEEQGELDKAINIYQKGLKIDPNNPRLHYNLGIAYEYRENLDNSLEEFKTALKINPNLIEAHNNLGMIYEKINRLEDAVKSYGTALEINPNYTKALNNLALVYEKLGESDKAVNNYKKAISIDPKYDIAKINLGRAYLNDNEIKKAKKTFEDIIRDNPDNFDAYNDLARAEIKLKNFKKAIEIYKYILESKREDFNVRNELKDLYLELNMINEAKEELKKIRKLSQGNINRTIDVARSYFKAKDYKESTKIVEEILKKFPDNSDALLLFSDILIAIKDYERALKVLHKLEKLGVKDNIISHNYALCYQGMGKISKALTLMERLINKPPGQKLENEKSDDFDLLGNLLSGYEAEMQKLEKESDEERKRIREKLHDIDFKAILEGAKASVDSIEKNENIGKLSIDDELKGLQDDDVPILNVGDTEPDYLVEEEEENIDLDKLEVEKETDDEKAVDDEGKIIEPVTNSLINLLNDEDTYSDKLFDNAAKNIDMSKRLYQNLANNFSSMPVYSQGNEQQQMNQVQPPQNSQVIPPQNVPLMPQQNLVVPQITMPIQQQAAGNSQGLMNQFEEKINEIDQKLDNFSKQVVEKQLDDKLKEIDEKLLNFKENLKNEFEGNEKYTNIEDINSENPLDVPEEFEYDIDVENAPDETDTLDSGALDDSITIEEEDENIYDQPEESAEDKISINEEEEFMPEELNVENPDDNFEVHKPEEGPYEKLRTIEQADETDTLYRENGENNFADESLEGFNLIPLEEAANGGIDLKEEIEDITDTVNNAGVKKSNEPGLFGKVNSSDYSEILDYFPPVDLDYLDDFESKALSFESHGTDDSSGDLKQKIAVNQTPDIDFTFKVKTKKIRGREIDIFY